MSVQAGIWNFDDKPIDRHLIDELSESLKQQGPDGDYRHMDGPLALLYRPFHTTAESRRENQPHLSRRGFIVTWDGRLDNRNELHAGLGDQVELGATDIAVVAAAFDRWNTDCFRRIVGDWAVSICKPSSHELILATDFIGIRHIFYHLKKDCVSWSTDLSPLVLLSGDKFHIDDEYIAGYLARDPEAHLTPYREIRQVPPGHFVRIQGGKVEVERFWCFSPRSRIRYKRDVEYEEHFLHVFRQAVRRRLRSDSPILAELSGGLDSSSIVCMADELIAKEGWLSTRLDTISFYDDTEPNGDDSVYFRKIERARGRSGVHIDLSKLRSQPEHLGFSEFNVMPGALGIGGELEGKRASAIRAGGYRAVLSGIGGDEFLGGNPDPSAHLADLVVSFKFAELARQLAAWSLAKRRPWIHLLWESAMAALPASTVQYVVSEARIEPWIGGDFAKRTRMAIRQVDVNDHFGMWLPSRRSYAAGVQLMARKLAKFTGPVAAPEELRYPYLDQNLIEFILSIPATQLLRPRERRSLMRRSLAGIVPAEILARRTKQVGARTPALILEKHWRELQSTFETSLISVLGYVHEDLFLNAISDARAGKTVALARVLWTISLEYWLRDLAQRGLLDLPSRSASRAIPRKFEAVA